MKKIFIVVLYLFVVTQVFSQRYEITNGGLFVSTLKEDGSLSEAKKITSKSTPAELEAFLGSPDKISDLANTVWTWNNTGVLFYFSPSDGKLKEIHLEFVNTDYKYSPDKPFAGELIIFGHKINQYSSLASLKEISQLEFDQNPLYKQNATTSYLTLFLHELDQPESMDMVAISIKEEKRTKPQEEGVPVSPW